MSDKKKFIRDSVYGDIRLNEFEIRIMDMPQFQRLRRIKQLGLISLIYPGATHTRFEHCVGTMNLGSKLAEELGLTNYEIELIRASGLLHDIGHGPFSHVSEGVLSFPHEELTKYVVTETSMRDLLEEKFDINEVVVLNKNDTIYLGRVIAVGGDTVDITDDATLIVNGNAISEPKIFYTTPRFEGYEEYPQTVPEGEYFILVDKRESGEDSRYYGMVKEKEIKGSVVTIIRRNNL